MDTSGATTTSAAVTVQVTAAANLPPSVTLTSPANNASFTAPASIVITASASDSDSGIAQVDFYAGSAFIGRTASAPYTFTWKAVAVGNYSLTARATDRAGATTTSAAVVVRVKRK
ncbi:MAG: Ig-like domain-containing protein [Vicinamibacterales bacterium]